MLSITDAILQTLHRLFKLDNVTHMASVEMWVLLTTVLLVLRFVLDFQGPWFGKPGSIRMLIVVNLEILNQSLVIYTMGLMQLSSTTKVNDYFQVWAVLLVTLQYSVKIGRPYTRSKQAPLLDLMSSLWSANLLRVQTFKLLRIPLWSIWSLNAARIIVAFASSSKGEANNQESTRLVSEYMRYEDSLSVCDDAPGDQQKTMTTMRGYKYVVHGEHRVLKEVQDAGRRREGRRRASGGDVGWYKIQLDPDGQDREKLVTVEKIWDGTDTKQRSSWLLGAKADLKDLCLSFALYKLLRRRIYDLPMHELSSRRGKKKMGRLVVDYVLGEGPERAFRITGMELSFLRDLFYSKHATMFAGGLWEPLQSLLLSLCLAMATGYIAYPARYIPGRMDPADRNRITHGVFITRLMVAIIVLKELLEIFLYVSSRWAKVLMLCKYVQVQRPVPVVVERVMRFLLSLGRKPKWEACAILQQNLLVQVRLLPLFRKSVRGARHGRFYLTDYTKTAILDSIKKLKLAEEQGRLGLLDSYFSNAFAAGSSKQQVEWPCCCDCDLKVDTHIILVWHMATCLCEIYFLDEVKRLSAVQWQCRLRPLGTMHLRREWYEQYITAVSLSNYCVYLVKKALVPDNRLVAWKVLDEVIREINHLTTRLNRNGVELQQVYDCLMGTVKKQLAHDPDDDVDVESRTTTQGGDDEEEDDEDLDIGRSLTRMGAVLGKNLTEAYHDDAAGLWRDLATFWTGFLLHLAANTGAATHGKHLAGDTELITHLWALLTHAGFRGNPSHGEEGLDEEDIPDIDVATN